MSNNAYRAILGAAVVLLAPSGLLADDAIPQPGITVTGVGHVSGRPDTAEIHAGVMTQAATAAQSLSENSDAMAEVFEFLIGRGIADEDVQTLQLRISPQYDYAKGSQPPKLIGYQASNNLRITINNIAELGMLLDGLVNAGANQLNGVSFSIRERVELLDQARLEAMADAARKAQLYAQVAGISLGAVEAIRETTAAIPVAEIAMGRAQAVPIASGELDYRVVVTVQYGIEP